MNSLNKVDFKELDKSVYTRLMSIQLQLLEAKKLGKDTVILEADLKEYFNKWSQLV